MNKDNLSSTTNTAKKIVIRLKGGKLLCILNHACHVAYFLMVKCRTVTIKNVLLSIGDKGTP